MFLYTQYGLPKENLFFSHPCTRVPHRTRKMYDHYPWTVDYSYKKLATLYLFWFNLNDKNQKKNTDVHIRTLLSLLWTCMSILVRGGFLYGHLEEFFVFIMSIKPE